jgi:hypothetical protein
MIKAAPSSVIIGFLADLFRRATSALCCDRIETVVFLFIVPVVESGWGCAVGEFLFDIMWPCRTIRGILQDATANA